MFFDKKLVTINNKNKIKFLIEKKDLFLFYEELFDFLLDEDCLKLIDFVNFSNERIKRKIDELENKNV